MRLPDGELRAFSQQCTHLGCVVHWSRERERMLCPCHDGAFDARTGSVVGGPPQRSLARIAVEERSDGMVWALGREVG